MYESLLIQFNYTDLMYYLNITIYKYYLVLL